MERPKRLIRLVLIGLSVGGGVLAPTVSKSLLIQVATSMVGLAGVVVTVFGIWVAVIFPKMLANVELSEANAGTNDKRRYDVLISSLYRSCFTLCANLFVFIVVSFYVADLSSRFFTFSVVGFLWLSFFSIVESLWSAVTNGELSAVDSLNKSAGIGLLKRLRGRGKRAMRRPDQ